MEKLKQKISRKKHTYQNEFDRERKAQNFARCAEISFKVQELILVELMILEIEIEETADNQLM